MKVISGPSDPSLPTSRTFMPVVRVREKSITFAILTPVTEVRDRRPLQSWSEFADWVRTEPTDPSELAGKAIINGRDFEISDVPGVEGTFWNYGKVTLSLDGSFGLHELGDFTLMEFWVNSVGRPLGVFNRLDISKSSRAIQPNRARFIYNPDAVKGMTVVFPFAPTTTADAALIEVPWSHYKPILLDGAWDQERPPRPASPRLVTGLWSVQFPQNLTVQADQTISFDIQLVWNANEDYSWTGGTPIAKSIDLTLNASAGYLPKTKVTTDSTGKATVKVRASDLAAGDIIELKAEVGYFTKVGYANIAVV